MILKFELRTWQFLPIHHSGRKWRESRNHRLVVEALAHYEILTPTRSVSLTGIWSELMSSGIWSGQTIEAKRLRQPTAQGAGAGIRILRG